MARRMPRSGKERRTTVTKYIKVTGQQLHRPVLLERYRLAVGKGPVDLSLLDQQRGIKVVRGQYWIVGYDAPRGAGRGTTRTPFRIVLTKIGVYENLDTNRRDFHAVPLSVECRYRL